MNPTLVLSRILAALPAKRDWLDPDLEAIARAVVREYHVPFSQCSCYRKYCLTLAEYFDNQTFKNVAEPHFPGDSITIENSRNPLVDGFYIKVTRLDSEDCDPDRPDAVFCIEHFSPAEVHEPLLVE